MSYSAAHRLAAGPHQRRAFFQKVRPAAPSAPFRPLARILVSDDEPALRAIYAALLTDHGFEYLGAPAGNGAATLELARRARPHLVITDINKPGLDGHALRAALAADPATARVPVLMVSAMDPWATPGRTRPGPLDDYLVKPFVSEMLLYRMAALLPLNPTAHDRLVERARRLPCYEHYHPVTGLPCLHSLARALPALTGAPGWAALGVSLAGAGRLARAHGRAAADGALARLAGLLRGMAGSLVVAHLGFDPQIALVGPVAQVAEARAALARRAALTWPGGLSLPLRLRYADSSIGAPADILALRAALRP